MQTLALLVSFLLWSLVQPHQLIPGYNATDCATAYTTCESGQLCLDYDDNRLYVCDNPADSWTPVDPLTTKGDVMVYSTIPIRLAVGSDADVLVADSGEAAGIKWDDLENIWSCGTASGDPDSCAANSTTRISLTASGLASGHLCIVDSGGSPINDDLLMLTARSGTNVIYIDVYNPTGGAIDEGSASVYYCCMP